jgi:nitric oxide reductase activation protein
MTDHPDAEVHFDVDEAIEVMKALTGHDDFGDAEEQSKDGDADRRPDKTELLVEQAIGLEGWIDGDLGGIEKLTMNRNDYAHRAEPWEVAKYDPPTTTMTIASQRMRLAFTANAASNLTRNLYSGRIDSRTMAHRIPTGNERLFARRNIKRKKDWTILCGLDISGSTQGYELEVEKRLARAFGDLFTDFMMPFSMWAHTGRSTPSYDYNLVINPIKRENESWAEDGRPRLAGLKSGYYNLDGHTMEVYRKLLQRQRGTDRLLLYFTDGAMPAENRHEELRVLQREIEFCRRQGIYLLGVGIGTDSPKAHGLDTIIADSVEDVPRLLVELGERLTM